MVFESLPPNLYAPMRGGDDALGPRQVGHQGFDFNVGVPRERVGTVATVVRG